MVETFFLHVLGCSAIVHCEDSEARTLLLTNYRHMQVWQAGEGWQYTVGKIPGSAAFFIRRAGQPPLVAANDSEFLWLFEKDFSIELEKRRHDLYFVHSAVVELAGRACLLVGASGHGKSTLTWGLLHHGCGYFSDELAPIDLHTWMVLPYPRALCLKAVPPSGYPLPQSALTTTHTFYIPITAVAQSPAPVAMLVFVHYSPRTSAPTMRAISSAEAGARLFAYALNPLAHPGYGLDGALAIAAQSACFVLESAQLSTTCNTVIATLHTLVRGQ